MKEWIQQGVAEAVGVFALVFIGAGAALTGGSGGAAFAPAKILEVAFAHGIALAVGVTAALHISGGHINPAVTLGALVADEIEPWRAGVYWVSQLLGGLVAALALLASIPGDLGNLATPALGSGVGVGTGILVEAILTFLLVYVVFETAIDHDNPPVGGFAIGLTVTVDILMGGPITGAAMNPARWFGPAVVAGAFSDWYVWWIGPGLGGIAAGALYRWVLSPHPPEDTGEHPEFG